MAKSPPRSKQSSNQIKAKIDRRSKHNKKETDAKSLSVKKEALSSARGSNYPYKSILKNVTPDKKKKGAGKTEQDVSKTNADDHIPMEIDEDISHIDRTNVYDYLLARSLSDLRKLETTQMQVIIQAWKGYRGLSEIHDIESVSETFLTNEMEDIKIEASREQQSDQLARHLEKDINEDLIEQARLLKLDAESTVESIGEHDKDVLAYFLNSKSNDLEIEELLKLEHVEMVDMVACHLCPETKSQKKLDPQFYEGGNNPQAAGTTLVEKEELAPKIKFSKNQGSSESPLRSSNQVSPSDGILKIDADLTDDQIKNATMNQLQQMFHDYSIQTGEEIPESTIQEWDRPFLTEVCTTKRNNAKIQKRMLQQIKPKDSQRTLTSSARKIKLRQTNLINPGTTKSTCRYSLHFTIPTNYKGTDGLREFLSLIFAEMIKYGKDLCLLPWSTDEIIKPISNIDLIPTTITGLTKYFDGARSPETSKQMYLKIRLGYSIEMKKDNFDVDVQGWCKAQMIQMYECSVQHPNVRSCGWLVYAPRTLNHRKWCQKVTQMYNEKFVTRKKEPFQLGLTWRALNGQWEIDKKNKIRAMHIDAPVEIAPRVKNFLRLLAQKKKWPLNVRFRVMDEYNKYMKESTKQKYRYMLSKHTTLQTQMGVCECTQIINLDKRIGSSQMTIRDIILNVRDKKDGHRVFGSIDEKWNSDSIFVATYRPDKSALAYDFVRSLSTYASFLYPNTSFKRILTAYAIDKAVDESYNPMTQTFTTQEDIDLDREIQADLDDDSMNYANPDDIQNPFEFDDSVRLVGGESVWDLNGDDDTASTNQPNGMGNVSFDSAVCRYYDTNSCATSVNSSNSSVNQTPSLQRQIEKERKILEAATLSNTIQEEESNDKVADRE